MNAGFFRSTAVVGAVTFLSRITGLIRDMVFTRVFPASTGVLDAFLVAYQIPNFLRRLFAEGAFSQAFVPVVSQYRAHRSHDEVASLVGNVAGTLGVVLSLVSLVGVLLAPVVVMLFAPGMAFDADESRFELTTQVLRWTFPYVLFVSITALAGGVLNSYQHFAIPAFASVLLNVVLIGFAAWISPNFDNPAVVLAIGVFVGGILQVAIHLPVLKQLRLLRWPRVRFKDPGVRRIFQLMGPAILGSSMGQLAVALNSIVASFMATGSYAWLYCADRLVEFPLGVFAIALSTVILPSLSTQHAHATPQHFSDMLDWALKLVVIVVVPASVALFVLAGPLTVVMFHNGDEFAATDVYMTRAALMAYAFALLGWSVIKVLAPGYFARQDTTTPMRVALQGLGVNIGLNVIALIALAVMGRLRDPGMHTILAATNAVGAIVNAGLLFMGLRKAGVLYAHPGWAKLSLQVLVATVVMVLFLLWNHGELAAWMEAATLERVYRLGICVFGGVVIYLAALAALGMRPSQFKMH